MFFFFLFYYKTQKALSEGNLVVLKDFGFEKGATFELKFLSLESIQHASIFLLNHEEKSQLPKNIMNATEICANSSSYTFASLTANPESAPLQDKIPNSGVYYPFVADCSNLLNGKKLQFKIEMKFENPSTHLDTRQVNLLYTLPILIIISAILLAMWYINWFNHRNVGIKLHSFMTATFTCAFLSVLFDYFLILKLNKSDNDGGLFLVSKIVQLVAAAILFSTLLLASKGWCIIKDKIKICEIALSLFYSFIFMALEELITFVYLGEMEIFVLLIAIIFIGLFIRELISSINDASLHIIAHKLVIQNEGIDPESTPIAFKHRMYQYFQYTVVAGCIAIILRIAVSSIFGVDEWIDTTLSVSIAMILLTILGLIFKLRDQDVAGYSFVGTNHGEHSMEIPLNDIEDIKDSRHELKQEEPLPAPPVDVPTTAEIVIASPNGKQAIKAEMSKNPEMEDDLDKLAV